MKLFLISEETDLLSFKINSIIIVLWKTQLVERISFFFCKITNLADTTAKVTSDGSVTEGICLLGLKSRQTQDKIYSKQIKTCSEVCIFLLQSCSSSTINWRQSHDLFFTKMSDWLITRSCANLIYEFDGKNQELLAFLILLAT